MDTRKVARLSPKQHRSLGYASNFSVGYGDYSMHPDQLSEKSSSAKHVQESKKSNGSDVRASYEHSQFPTTVSNHQLDPPRCSLVHCFINGNEHGAADVPRTQSPNSIKTAIRARLRVVCHPSQDSGQADQFEDKLPVDVSLVAELGHNEHSQNNTEAKKRSKSLRVEIERGEQAKTPNSKIKLQTHAGGGIQQANNDFSQVQHAAKVEKTQNSKLPQTRSSPGSAVTSRTNAVELSSSLPHLHISRATRSGQQPRKTPSEVENQDADHEPKLTDSQVIVSLHTTRRFPNISFAHPFDADPS